MSGCFRYVNNTLEFLWPGVPRTRLANTIGCPIRHIDFNTNRVPCSYTFQNCSLIGSWECWFGSRSQVTKRLIRSCVTITSIPSNISFLFSRHIYYSVSQHLLWRFGLVNRRWTVSYTVVRNKQRRIIFVFYNYAFMFSSWTDTRGSRCNQSRTGGVSREILGFRYCWNQTWRNRLLPQAL